MKTVDKVKELEEECNRLWERFRKLEANLGGIVIKYCPKCKHKTPQREHCLTLFTCLVCGKRWVYFTEEHCRESKGSC